MVTLRSGPWRGVRYTDNPYDISEDALYDAINVFIERPGLGGSVNQRPGFARPTSVSSANHGQGVHRHVATDGTPYNFLVVGGAVYRWSTDLTSAPTNVTPTNVSIATTGRVSMVSLGDTIVFTDGVNKPWAGTNLTGTPITATLIEQQTPANVLSIGSNDVRLANTAFTGTWSGTQATFAANAVGTAVGALGQIAANTWGIILVEATNSTTLAFTAAFNAGAGYATETLAIAALPARTLGRRYVGYVTVRADAGAVWIAGTDAFATGTTGNQAQTTNYYAGEGPAYSVFGQPVLYYGAVFWIYTQIETVAARTTMGWSEPNEPTVGYQQTDYDNQWTLTQTSSAALYALAPTNDALYYFRANSIGAVAGAPGINFQGTATHDVVSGAIGCVAYASVQVALGVVYFADQIGRPWRFVVGGTPDPIWRQADAHFQTFAATTITDVPTFSTALIEPNLSLYLVALVPGAGLAPTTWLAFDVVTGTYCGRFYVGDGSAMRARTIGLVSDASNGLAALFLQDSATSTVYLWRLTRTNESVWADNSGNYTINVSPGWMTYGGTQTWRGDEVRALFTSSSGGAGPTWTFQSVTTGGNVNVVGTLTSVVGGFASDTNRVTFKLDSPLARGIGGTLFATNVAVGQNRFYAIEMDAVAAGRSTVLDP